MNFVFREKNYNLSIIFVCISFVCISWVSILWEKRLFVSLIMVNFVFGEQNDNFPIIFVCISLVSILWETVICVINYGLHWLKLKLISKYVVNTEKKLGWGMGCF